MQNERNWAGNYRYSAGEILVPESVSEVQELVARSPRIKVLGSRHSFNGIADTTGSLISLQKLNRVIELDEEKGTVTVEGGIRYGDLASHLHEKGYGLHNLASLPHITVAGAIATATHGSGVQSGNLATAVRALEIIAADGESVTLSRDMADAEGFHGAVVGLGGLGVVTKVTLDMVPTFEVSQHVYEQLPLEQLGHSAEAILSEAYSVSLFTDWRDSSFNQVWLKRRVGTRQRPTVIEMGFMERLPQAPLSIPCLATPEMSAAGRWACRVLGMSGCRISGWTSLRARAKSCRANISCRGSGPMRPCRRLIV